MKKIEKKYWSVPQWLVKWHHMQLLANLYPVLFGIFAYLLITFLPRNVISQYSWIKVFVDFIGDLVPGVSAFSDNTALESIKFTYALSWAMLPFWVPAYPWKSVLLPKRKYSKTEQLRRHRAMLTPNLKNRLVNLFLPLITAPIMWVCWSGYPFLGGPPDLLAPISFVNNFFIALLMYIFSQGFLLGLWLTAIAVFHYPALFRFAFSRK